MAGSRELVCYVSGTVIWTDDASIAICRIQRFRLYKFRLAFLGLVAVQVNSGELCSRLRDLVLDRWRRLALLMALSAIVIRHDQDVMQNRT